MTTHESERKSENESDEGMPVYRQQLLETLQSVKVGSYAYGNSFYQFCPPHLNIHGIGHLSFPLCEHHLKAIIAQCALAPFGREEETIIDTTVRNTWQLSPTEFTVENKDNWEVFVDDLVNEACFELGFSNAIVEKQLYKLLVYEQGGFFLPHRDSEKENGMFASLIITLPSDYEGGQLVIRHNGKEKEFDFGGPDSSYTINYAAFYADCEHEVRAVTRGHRICLVYNIINTGQDPIPLPFDDTTLVEQTAESIRHWESDPNGPIKLVYLLKHKYTNNSLSFRNLKGDDRAVGQLMKQIQIYIGAMVGLANLKWKCNLNLENDDEDEVNFGKMTMAPIINVDDDIFADKALGVFIQDQVLNQKLFNSCKPQEHAFATGNEGVSVDRQYQATGLVFCPKKNSSIMRWDLMGAELSIKKMAMITEVEGAHEQAQALLKSTVLKPTTHFEIRPDFSRNSRFLIKLLTSLRQLHLVDVYLDTIRQNVMLINLDSDLETEFIQGCSELGWTEISPAIQQYFEYFGKIETVHCILRCFHCLAFSPIPNNDQQRQSRSDLLDYILNKIDSYIGKMPSYLHFSWPTLIGSLHHLGYHSMLVNLIGKFAMKEMCGSNTYDITKAAMSIIKTTDACQSCNSFEPLIQPCLISLIEQTISILNKSVSKKHPVAIWEHKLQCKCKDCEKVKAFAYNLTAEEEQLTVNCNKWKDNIEKWARVEYVQEMVKQEGPVTKKMKMTKERTILLTKSSDIKRLEKDLQAINYLQSLPYYHTTGANK